MKYIDAHSHWADPRLGLLENPALLKTKLENCLTKNIHFFLQGGVSPADWQRQIEIKKLFPDNFGLCFGLHPYFVSENEMPDCELALDSLTLLLPSAMALGEAGLDFRPHIVKEKEYQQIEMFENQIELAKVFKKPMVLHIVQAHEKALQIFDVWQAPETAGFIHAFNGSYEIAKKYIDLGFYISVGGALTYEKNKKLQECIKKIPLEFLLIESDSPDQPPEGVTELNSSESIYNVARVVAEIRNSTTSEVLELAAGNYSRVIGLY